MGYNPAEQAFLRETDISADSFESHFEDDAEPMIARAISTRTRGTSQARMAPAKGNPPFKAQFDVTMLLKHFTLTGGAYTAIAPAALNAALKNSLSVYLFGASDFQSGYVNLRKYFPVNANWIHGRPIIYGRDILTELALDATVTAQLQLGDVIIPFTSPLPGAGTTTLALVIVRCTQVAYGSLLIATASDKFVMNMIRYVIPDTTKINQYTNNIGKFKQTLYGKGDLDYISPNSQKKPEQMQDGLIDIPVSLGIDKQTSLGQYLNYDIGEQSFSIFVWSTQKIAV